MIVKSYQVAFAEADEPLRVRPINIPDERAAGGGSRDLLELAFELGQNEFQPVAGCYSLSVGDVVELPDGTLWRCAPVGWTQLPAGTDPEALPRGREARMAAADAFYGA